MTQYAFNELSEAITRGYHHEDGTWESSQTSFGDLYRLTTWLYGERKDNGSGILRGPPNNLGINLRIAPSVIIRSEMELTCLSSPRFAVRIELGDRGFINARRIRATERSVRYADVTGDLEDHLVDVIRSSSWIADSLLKLPDDLRDSDYKVLTANLLREYDCKENGEFVPYVKHIALGGGECAQAVCFMALCLLPDCMTLGPSEITAKIHQVDTELFGYELPVSGAEPDGICKFYREHSEDKATADRQYVRPVHMVGETDVSTFLLEQALYGYLQSGSPLHYMVSLSRMYEANDSLQPVIAPQIIPKRDRQDGSTEDVPAYQDGDRSRVPITKLHEDAVRKKRNDAPDDHSVLLVGWKEGKEDTDIKKGGFLLNDPASFPFLPATTDQLRSIRPYKIFDDEDKNEEKLTEADLDYVEFIPVLHKDVKAFLLPRKIETIEKEKDVMGEGEGGLILKSFAYFQSLSFGSFFQTKSIDYGPEEIQKRSSWWLAKIVEGEITGQFGKKSPFPKEMNPSMAKWAKIQDKPRWVWFQFIDAPPGRPADLKNPLLGLPQSVSTTWWAWDATQDAEGPGFSSLIGCSVPGIEL